MITQIYTTILDVLKEEADMILILTVNILL